MKITIKYVLNIIIIVLLVSFNVSAKVPSWIKYKRIIHAGGGIDNVAYTNSSNALNKTIKKKEKVVELDFCFTSDGVLVCTHNNVNSITAENFLSKKINKKYKPMTAKTALKKLINAKNIYLVVDTKEEDIIPVYKEINNICKSYGSSGKNYRKKIIPQLYKKSDFKRVKNIYNYKNYIFSVYKLKNKNYSSIAKFCSKSGIKTVTIPKEDINSKVAKAIKKYNLILAAHTINDKSEYEALKDIGVEVIYTDFLYTK